MYAVILKETNDQGQERYEIMAQFETKEEAFKKWCNLGGTAKGYDIIDL